VTNLKNNNFQSFSVCEECVNELNDNNNSCEFCGMTLEELIKYSRMGCANCYSKFEKFLLINLEKLQKSSPGVELKHVGKIPYSWKKQQSDNLDPRKFLLELKQKLALSINKENYDKSLELKNKIFAFENLVNKIEENKSNFEQVALIKKQISDFIFLFREQEELKEK
jgi:protein-arginine kinase activator protein McsA